MPRTTKTTAPVDTADTANEEGENLGPVLNPDGTPSAVTVEMLTGVPQEAQEGLSGRPWTGKPVPDLSAYSATKRLALLKCWLGAAQYKPEAVAKYGPHIARAEQDVAAELSAKVRAKMEREEQVKAEREAKLAKVKADRAAASKARAEARAAAKAAQAAPEATLPPTESQPTAPRGRKTKAAAPEAVAAA